MNEEITKKITALEVEVQKLREWKALDKKIVLDSIAIEVERLQKANETIDPMNLADIRENAKCIAELGRIYVKVIKANQY